MKKLFIYLVLTLLAGVINAQVTKTVNVNTAGTLSTLLTSTEKATVTDLTVTGNIDARDFNCMYKMNVLANIDISNSTIKSWDGTNNTLNMFSMLFPENELPTWAFYTGCSMSTLNSKETLKSIILPKSLTSLGSYSLCCNYSVPCENFRKIIVTSTNVPILNSGVFASCTYTNATLYVPQGSLNSYKSADGWKSFVNIVGYNLSVSTISATQIQLTSAVLNGKIDLINQPVTSYGFCWNTTGSPTVSDNKVDQGATTSTGSYDYTLANLQTAAKYYVRAYATDANGTVYGNEISFTTASLPSAAGSISGLQTVCQGQNSVIYSVPAIDNATSYIWTLPTGITGSSSTNTITANYSRTFTSGSITVKGHNQWGDGTSSALAVTANLLPADAGTITGSTIICQGESNITYSVPEIANATSYVWTLPTGVTGTSTTNSITVNYSKTALSGNVSVKGHNDCGDGTASALAITVNKLPVITTTDRTLICGGSVALRPSISYTGTGSLKYKWTPATGLDNDSIANPTATATGNITYSVTVTTSNGCTASGEVKVMVNSLTANAGVDKTVVCGATVQLGSVTTNYTGAGILKYKWTPATGLSNDSIANPTATVTNDITYTITVTTPNGCTAADDVKVKIIPMDKPQIGIVSVNSSNKNIVVWNKPSTIGIESYSIYRETNITDIYEKIGSVPFADLSVFVDNSSNPDIKSNKYKLSIVDKSGQESPLSDPHKTMHLSINKGQNNTWNLIWEPYTGFTVSTYNIYRGTSATSLNFIDATSGSSSQYSDVTAPAGDVYYQVEVISPGLVSPSQVRSLPENVKSSESTVMVSYNSSRSNMASSISNAVYDLNADNNKIQIYPNPVKDILKIEYAGGSEFEILNLMGQVVYCGNLNKSASVQTSGFASGLYLIRFKANKTFEYKRMIKE